jgi:hypothetical protein
MDVLALSDGRICLDVILHRLGPDICVIVTGGQRPHIGAVSMSVARRSLRGDGTVAASTSNLTLTGHKDDVVARELSETLTLQTGQNVVVICGIHIDQITAQEIETVRKLVRESVPKILSEIGAHPAVWSQGTEPARSPGRCFAVC